MNDQFDIEAIKSEVKNQLQGAFYGAGAGAAFVQLSALETANDTEVLRIACQMGVNPYDYLVDDTMYSSEDSFFK